LTAKTGHRPLDAFTTVDRNEPSLLLSTFAHEVNTDLLIWTVRSHAFAQTQDVSMRDGRPRPDDLQISVDAVADLLVNEVVPDAL
jgi:hypothetical protein